MKNIEYKVDGTKLIITIDLAKEFGDSKSGKSVTVASTEGNVSVDGAKDVKLGINCYKPKK